MLGISSNISSNISSDGSGQVDHLIEGIAALTEQHHV
jgi:hypothetical protein